MAPLVVRSHFDLRTKAVSVNQHASICGGYGPEPPENTPEWKAWDRKRCGGGERFLDPQKLMWNIKIHDIDTMFAFPCSEIFLASCYFPYHVCLKHILLSWNSEIPLPNRKPVFLCTDSFQVNPQPWSPRAPPFSAGMIRWVRSGFHCVPATWCFHQITKSSFEETRGWLIDVEKELGWTTTVTKMISFDDDIAPYGKSR